MGARLETGRRRAMTDHISALLGISPTWHSGRSSAKFPLVLAVLEPRPDSIKQGMTMQLNSRAELLLKTLIERYITEGEPVGSRTLARHAGLDLSPATIRNVMVDLEEMGLISSPHTSAGRIPTQ